MEQETLDCKSYLVLEICSISTRSVVCVHRVVSNPNKAPFIDWYCILGVEENAGLNTIRKQYHKLALQLHPDKNKHPKAEIAFKLVSEAYTCLSDATKRKAFNLERCRMSFCFECNRIPHAPCNNNNNNNVPINSSFNTSRSRSSKLWRNIRDIRERLREEAKVIENCLQANSMSKKESPLYNPSDYYYLHNKHNSKFGKEIPVFNPSNNLYQGYPHMRNHVYKNNNNSESCRYLQAENDKGDAKKYPVFEVKTQRRSSTSSMFTRKFVPVPSQC